MAAPEDLWNQVRDALVGGEAGNTRILGVEAREGEDSDGESAVFLDLLLTNPPRDTWPVEDIWELRQLVREAISELPVEGPWFIRFAPQDSGELDPEDTEEAITV